MTKTVKTFLAVCLTLVAIFSFGMACDGNVKATVTAPEYLVVKTGDSVSLDKITAVDDSGNECAISISVTDISGKSVAVDGKKFIATTSGKYTVTVNGGKGVTADAVTFYVYATSDGKAYSVTPPVGVPETAEWGQECILPLTKAVHVTETEVFADIRVYDKDGEEVHVYADRFVPKKLGKHTVKYSYGGGEYSTEIDCVDTVAPIVILRNNATATPAYGESFLLPYVGVIDAQEDESKRVIKCYSEDSEREIEIVNDRIKVDASKYFTYYVYAEDVNGLSAEYEFIINRAFNADIDTFTLRFEGNTVKWEDRTAKENLNGYHPVTGYAVSLDGGQTVAKSVSVDVNEYAVSSNEFCEIVVTELSDDNTRESAISKTLLFDGELPENVLANFNRVEYTGVVSQGAYDTAEKGFTWNYQNSLSLSVNTDGYNDGAGTNVTSGVLVLNNSNPCQVKITFPKQNDKLLEDSVLVLKIYGNDDWVYLSKLGQSAIGTRLSTYGYQSGKWQEVRIPVSAFFGKTAGEYLEGFQLAFKNTVIIDEARLVSLSSNLTGEQVANFNMEEYSAMLAITENFEWNSANRLKYSVMTEGINDGTKDSDGGVLELYTLDYAAALQITFPKKVIVDEYSYIELDLYETANDSSSWTTRVAKYGAKAASTAEYGNAGVSLAEYGHVKGSWNTVRISLIDFGYSIGDTLEGIQFVVRDNDKTGYKLYVDEIRVGSLSDKIDAMKAALDKGVVADYNDPDYSMFITLSGNTTTATIENGTVSVYSSSWKWQTFKFLIPKTVADGDYLVLRAQANDRVRIAKDASGTNGKELFHSDPKNQSNFCVGFSTDMQTIMIPVSVFSYASGDTMSSISIGWWNNAGTAGTFVIDYIAYISAADLSDGVVADYDYSFSDCFVQKPTFYYTTLNGSPYSYSKAETVAYDSEIGAVTASPSGTNEYRAVRVSLLKSVTVTENTVFTVTMRYTPSSENNWIYLRGKLSADSGLHDRLNMTDSEHFTDVLTIGENFDTVTFKATEIFEIGETVEYLEIAFRNGSIAFKTVSVSEAA